MLKKQLQAKVAGSLYNRYGAENFDESRYGTFVPRSYSIKNRLIEQVKKWLGYQSGHLAGKRIQVFDGFFDRFEKTWQALDEDSRILFTELIAYRLMGASRVKLSTNNAAYRKALRRVQALVKDDAVIDPHFLNYTLQHFDLRSLGYDIEIFYTAAGIVIDFLLEQYSLKKDGIPFVSVQPGDTVIDAGGCWGDTALYFASKTGPGGKVFSFEFNPANIAIFQKNLALNPGLAGLVELVDQPVSDESGQKMYYRDFGPGSKIGNSSFGEENAVTTTISIDDFVAAKKLEKLDFIKMDIEGAEPAALRGCLQTLKKFRPQLAIAIYHSLDDFANIPNWILEQDLGYEIHLGHYTIHEEETMLFCRPRP